jgi:hypothetical protein
MAEGLAAAEANQLLDAWIAEYGFIQLHTAAPGAAGTTAIAGNATRKDWTAAFAPATGGVATSDVDIDWTDGEVDTSEDYTHWTAWSLVTGGVFGGSGTITANAVDASGDAFSILAGGVTISFTVAT